VKKTNVISEESQKAARWPCSVGGRGVGNNYSVIVVRIGYARNVVV